MRRILGISGFYHDSAACLVENGEVVAALQEERFSRKKHDSSFPLRALQGVLSIGNCSIRDVDCIVFYEKPFLKLERLLETYLDNSPRGFRSYFRAVPIWFKEKLWIRDLIQKKLRFEKKILFSDHHESHAASAFYPSPFESAAVLTVDAVGEWTTTTLGRGQGHQLHLEQEIQFPHSLGLLYSAFTYYLGFRVNSGEYKVMGLAPYGRPVFTDLIFENLVRVAEDGSFRLNRRFFDYETGLTMTSPRFDELFEGSPRSLDQPLTQRHRDLAASIQRVVEEILLRTCRHLRRLTGETQLCLAGGVALNSVANGRILRESGFQQVWIQPAAGDAGGALGAALAVWHRYLENGRTAGSGRDGQKGSLLGTSYEPGSIRRLLACWQASYEELTAAGLVERTSNVLRAGAVVGWFQGRMEFGPRALGSRSILADARREDMKDRINKRIKYRESFRPFAPVVTLEAASRYFELDHPSPYMLLVAPVKENRRHEIPAVTHVDGSARVQTVAREGNQLLHSLISCFEEKTGCPVLLNTSLNVRGEPIVESPEQAYQCFMRTEMDYLVMDHFFLDKKKQPCGLEPTDFTDSEMA